MSISRFFLLFSLICFYNPFFQGGAGIQADIKTCCAFDVFATTAVVCRF